MESEDLDTALLAAHAANDASDLIRVYSVAGDRSEERQDVDPPVST